MTRRQMLAAGPGAFALGFCGMAALADTRDDALLALLSEFDGLERRMTALRGRQEGSSYEWQIALEGRVNAIDDAQAVLMEPLLDATASTLRGVQARARTLVLFMPEMLQLAQCQGWDNQMMAALLRDLLALPAG